MRATSGARPPAPRVRVLLFSASLGHRGGTIQRLKIWFSNMPEGVDLTYLYACAPGHDCAAVLGQPESVRMVEIRGRWIGAVRWPRSLPFKPELVVLRLAAAGGLAKELIKGRYTVVMPVLSDSDAIAIVIVRIMEKVLRRRMRIVCHCAGAAVPLHLASGSLRGRLFERALKAVYPRVDAIIAISERIKLDMVKEFSVEEGRVSVVPISVDPGAFGGGDRATLKDKPTVFGVLSRLEMVKFVDLTIRAVGRVLTTHAVRLKVYGEGAEEGALRELVHGLGTDGFVEFLGWAPAAEALKTIDCLVMSSRHEGTPRAILEAGCLGIPTIAPPVGGIPDIIQDGATGWLYPGGDVDALAARMRYVADHPEERLRVGDNMREYVNAVHTPYAEIRRLLEVLGGSGEGGHFVEEAET